VNQNVIQAAIAQVMPAAVDTGLFVSLCSISAPTPASGAPSGTYTAVTGLQDLACMDAPENFGSGISANEAKSPALTESMAMRHVLLNGYYALLSPSTNWGDIGWRATVDGVVYDLLGAEADSQQTQTRLRLRKVTT
jgi:hypothetical protein